MKIKDLFEDTKKHVAFCFGRMNPPTIGHKLLMDKVKEYAKGGDYLIFVTGTQDKKKNPLDYSTKVSFLKEMFPEYASHIVEDKSLNTLPKVANYLYNKGYHSATFVAGSDRIEQLGPMLLKYNNDKSQPDHLFYNFNPLNIESSGERDDAGDLSLTKSNDENSDQLDIKSVRATDARNAAVSDNLKVFQKLTGITDADLAHRLSNAVKAGLRVKEELTIESPIDLADPENPVISGYKGVAPASLKSRMDRASRQLKELSELSQHSTPEIWKTIIRYFPELQMNIEQIDHGLSELDKIHKRRMKSKVTNLDVESIQIESATAGATSAGSIATVVSPHISPGSARGKKSYIGSPGKSGTKAPPQLKVKSVNALDSNVSLFGGPAVVKR